MDWTAAGPARPASGGLTASELTEPLPDPPGSAVTVGPDRRSLGSRVHGYTLLLVVALVQVAWLVTLGYALLRLFS